MLLSVRVRSSYIKHSAYCAYLLVALWSCADPEYLLSGDSGNVRTRPNFSGSGKISRERKFDKIEYDLPNGDLRLSYGFLPQKQARVNCFLACRPGAGCGPRRWVYSKAKSSVRCQ